ncbi:coiled-coil domain-containing protein 27-like [Mustelus asterias]
MLHEKEKCVLILEDKVKILSEFEAESKRKDGIIASLEDQVTKLTQELNKTSDSNTIKTQAQTILTLQEEINKMKEVEGDNKRKDGMIANLRDEIWQQGLQISHLKFESNISISRTTLDDNDSLTAREYDWETKSELSEKSSEELHKEFQDSGPPDIKIVINLAEEGSEHGAGGNEMVDQGVAEFLDFDENPDYELEDEKPEELARLINQNEKLKKKLQELRMRCNISRGAVVSINRKCSLAEAQLRNAEAELERLQKELKERCNQLHDMSNKFSNLREKNNRIKIMTDLQKENINFRELIAELQSELAKKNEEIVKLKAGIDQLQLHITAEEVRKKQLQTEYDYATAQCDLMQRELQDLQIALKFTGTRLERFISKIVKAVYTAPGIVQPKTQISDEDTLEIFQKVLDDRLTFHSMLVDSGIPVPPLLGAEKPDSPESIP